MKSRRARTASLQALRIDIRIVRRQWAIAIVSLAAIVFMLEPAAMAQSSGLNGPVAITTEHKIVCTGENPFLNPAVTGIRVLKLDGTEPIQLTNYAFDDTFAAWTPDGARIVFSRRMASEDTTREIMIMNSNATNLQRLTTNSWTDDQPHVSPDGKRIAFHRLTTTTKRGVTVSRDDIYLMNVNGSQQTSLTAGLSSSLKYSDPRWSPDGSRVLFIARSDNGPWNNTASVWSIKTNATGLLKYTNTSNGADSDPAYNSKGTEIVFSRLPVDFIYQIFSDDYSNDWKIIRKNLSTGVETVLATGAGFTCPNWLDDSTILFTGLFYKGPDLYREIIRVPAAGGSMTPITSATYSGFVAIYVEFRK